jgi:hypothetical protein
MICAAISCVFVYDPGSDKLNEHLAISHETIENI